ncbi:MAG TPA: acetyl-CoA carboxylase biotin carboxyl carrier protein [Bryobacteraceae bacterium]|nr:acetyl-CoA carboxylase biotin carboxyl carrier protein [Bryobacteraceae bacterium]
MTIDEIRALIHLASETGVAELEVQRGENRVRIRRAAFATQQEIVMAPPPYAVSMPSPPPNASAPPAPTAPVTSSHEAPKEKPSDPTQVLVKSPIVGTFYEGPAPGAAPFVQIGSRVQAGQVLCIIESMKLMNEIESEASGIVESKLVRNGQPVEYGEALFAIRTI